MKYFSLLFLFVPLLSNAQSNYIPQKGDTVVEQNIHFHLDHGGRLMDEDSATKATIDKWISLMKQHSSLVIEVGVHTDVRGSERYNLVLSQKRAEVIVYYLVSKGIQEGRLRAVGYGESKLINHCENGVACSEVEHAENRRVEFVVLE